MLSPFPDGKTNILDAGYLIRHTPLIVHFRLLNDKFTVGITNPQAKQDAIANFLGENNKHIPVGVIVDDRPGKSPFDERWSWHFLPDSITMAENAIEVCDATPSYVESNLDDFLIDLDGQYCPWDTIIESIDGI